MNESSPQTQAMTNHLQRGNHMGPNDTPLPGASAGNTSAGGVARGAGAASMLSITSANLSQDTEDIAGKKDRFLFDHSAYVGMLVSLAVSVHIAASFVTVALYFSPPIPVMFDLIHPGWYAPFCGSLITYAVYVILAYFLRFSASAQGANPRSHGLLRTRLRQLRSRLSPYTDSNPGDPKLVIPKPAAIDILYQEAHGDPYRIIALQESSDCCNKVQIMLDTSEAQGPQWVKGTGYVNAWELIHRAEESLIEVEPIQLVVRGALHDKWSIQDSTLSNRDELLNVLIEAVEAVSPESAVYFKEHQPDKNSQAIQQILQEATFSHQMLVQIAEAVEKSGQPITIGAQDEARSQMQNEYKRVLIEAGARTAIHEVRRTLNQFRGNLWEELVRARNQLLGTIALVGLATHLLLCFAILIDRERLNAGNIQAATVFYIVGAVTGLFARFYREFANNRAVDDYGLSLTRLVATLPLSGLAGVGGVLISVLLYDTLGGNMPSGQIRLSTIFNLDDLRYLIIAAIFGLTPNLILQSLQAQTEKYVTALQRSSSKGDNNGGRGA